MDVALLTVAMMEIELTYLFIFVVLISGLILWLASRKAKISNVARRGLRAIDI
jgi:uncharacterized iron-regulated membrane protein